MALAILRGRDSHIPSKIGDELGGAPQSHAFGDDSKFELRMNQQAAGFLIAQAPDFIAEWTAHDCRK